MNWLSQLLKFPSPQLAAKSMCSPQSTYLLYVLRKSGLPSCHNSINWSRRRIFLFTANKQTNTRHERSLTRMQNSWQLPQVCTVFHNDGGCNAPGIPFLLPQHPPSPRPFLQLAAPLATEQRETFMPSSSPSAAPTCIPYNSCMAEPQPQAPPATRIHCTPSPLLMESPGPAHSPFSNVLWRRTAVFNNIMWHVWVATMLPPNLPTPFHKSNSGQRTYNFFDVSRAHRKSYRTFVKCIMRLYWT